MPEIVESLVSTIIPVYNRPEMLPEAVESVLAQTYRPIEIVISDDGSTDETAHVAQSLANEYPDEIGYVRNQNRGPGPARETGRQMARGEFIQYLDSDDLLHPTKFEIQVQALRRQVDCGIAYGRTRLVEFGGRVLADPFKSTGDTIDRLFPQLLVERWWCTHTPLYRRSLCDKIGPWSTLRYSQDWEYDGRAGAFCPKLVWCDETVSDHRQHGAERQTGGGHWLSPSDRVHFFSRLHGHARQASVSTGSPEMQHFSRWVFHHARMCAAMGDAASSRQCHELACRAAGGVGLKLRLYRMTASCFGWRRTGKWICRLDGSLTNGLVRGPRERMQPMA